MLAKLINYFKKHTDVHSTERIAKVLAGFETMITELQNAIDQGDAENDNHLESIEMLKRQILCKEEHMQTIIKAQEKACTVANNLRKLLGD